MRRSALGNRPLAGQWPPRCTSHVRSVAPHGPERHGVHRPQTAPYVRRALERVRSADLAPAVRRHPHRPHALGTCGVPCLAGRARGRAILGRFLAAWPHRAIAALGPWDLTNAAVGGAAMRAAPGKRRAVLTTKQSFEVAETS